MTSSRAILLQLLNHSIKSSKIVYPSHICIFSCISSNWCQSPNLTQNRNVKMYLSGYCCNFCQFVKYNIFIHILVCALYHYHPQTHFHPFLYYAYDELLSLLSCDVERPMLVGDYTSWVYICNTYYDSLYDYKLPRFTVVNDFNFGNIPE